MDCDLVCSALQSTVQQGQGEKHVTSYVTMATGAGCLLPEVVLDRPAAQEAWQAGRGAFKGLLQP